LLLLLAHFVLLLDLDELFFQKFDFLRVLPQQRVFWIFVDLRSVLNAFGPVSVPQRRKRFLG
jgi:hypothetical protein